ncbi:MAG: hypothetical protein ABJC79_07355 [Acidimicrobiia bacterium]
MEARRATLADTDELIRLAKVMLDAVGLGSEDTAWEIEARNRLDSGFADESVAAFVVDHPSMGGRCVASAAVSLQPQLPIPGNPAASWRTCNGWPRIPSSVVTGAGGS